MRTVVVNYVQKGFFGPNQDMYAQELNKEELAAELLGADQVGHGWYILYGRDVYRWLNASGWVIDEMTVNSVKPYGRNGDFLAPISMPVRNKVSGT